MANYPSSVGSQFARNAQVQLDGFGVTLCRERGDINGSELRNPSKQNYLQSCEVQRPLRGLRSLRKEGLVKSHCTPSPAHVRNVVAVVAKGTSVIVSVTCIVLFHRIKAQYEFSLPLPLNSSAKFRGAESHGAHCTSHVSLSTTLLPHWWAARLALSGTGSHYRTLIIRQLWI